MRTRITTRCVGIGVTLAYSAADNNRHYTFGTTQPQRVKFPISGILGKIKAL